MRRLHAHVADRDPEVFIYIVVFGRHRLITRLIEECIPDPHLGPAGPLQNLSYTWSHSLLSPLSTLFSNSRQTVPKKTFSNREQLMGQIATTLDQRCQLLESWHRSPLDTEGIDDIEGIDNIGRRRLRPSSFRQLMALIL